MFLFIVPNCGTQIDGTCLEHIIKKYVVVCCTYHAHEFFPLPLSCRRSSYHRPTSTNLSRNHFRSWVLSSSWEPSPWRLLTTRATTICSHGPGQQPIFDPNPAHITPTTETTSCPSCCNQLKKDTTLETVALPCNVRILNVLSCSLFILNIAR